MKELIIASYLLTREIILMALKIFGIKQRDICANLMAFPKTNFISTSKSVNGDLILDPHRGY